MLLESLDIDFVIGMFDGVVVNAGVDMFANDIIVVTAVV